MNEIIRISGLVYSKFYHNSIFMRKDESFIEFLCLIVIFLVNLQRLL